MSLAREARGMSKALSVDLRERVVAAIAAGASCRAAAARFGVSASSAIRWATLAREAGSVAPGPLGGDRRTARIEAHAPLILRLVERTSDITLKEIRADLAKAGVSAGIGTMWRFFDRRRITWKNVWPAPSARAFTTWSDQSTPTYPVTRHIGPGQDGDPRVLVLIKVSASERHFLCQVSRTP